MLTAILCLIGCQLIGELIREATQLPVPGPVIGMFLLTAILAVRCRNASGAIPPALERTAEALIKMMGLLFVPAGVGLIAETHLFREQWLPILAALFGSTVLSTGVTGLVMHWTNASGRRPDPLGTGASSQGVPR
jgi:holin-like protein